MSIHCQFCSSTDLRISRFRLKDLAHLMILYYPVRCWVCRERAYVPILQICKNRRDEHLRDDNALHIKKV
jgi:hypothetical protein